MPDLIVTEFPYIPVSRRAMSCRRPVQGVGANDSPYAVTPLIKGKRQWCPFYTKWHKMLRRCYNPHRLNIDNNRAYRDATVCDEWLSFMKFREWMAAQKWDGLELDKDIQFPGNNIYAPDKCLFVSRSVNTLFTGAIAGRDLPRGVTWNATKHKYEAEIKTDSARHYLGAFKTIEEASSSYRKAKREVVMKVAAEQTDYRVCDGLMRHAALLRA